MWQVLTAWEAGVSTRLLAACNCCSVAPVLGGHWFAFCPSLPISLHFLHFLHSVLSTGLPSGESRGPSSDRSRPARRGVRAPQPLPGLFCHVCSVRVFDGVALCLVCARVFVHMWVHTRVCSYVRGCGCVHLSRVCSRVCVCTHTRDMCALIYTGTLELLPCRRCGLQS